MKCHRSYQYSHVQYLFFFTDNVTQKSEKFEWDNFKPNSDYTCVATIVYDNYNVTEKKEIIKTDFGGEYIAYIYIKNFLSFYGLMSL